MNRDEALAYLNVMFGDETIAGEGLQIAVVSITPGAGKRGKVGYTFCETTTYAADTAIRIAQEGSNAYCGMSVVDPKTIKASRGAASDSRGIVAFWSDIDIADPMATKDGKNPPINHQEAMTIASAIGAAPSLVVDSGHGIHAYWLLDRPWIFRDDDERRHAGDVVRGFEQTLQQIARDRGRSLDSVGDLARVLRIPGTINTKIAIAPTNVLIIWPPNPAWWGSAKRFTPNQLVAMIKAPSDGTSGAIVKAEKLEGVEFRAPTELEQAKLEAKIAFAVSNNEHFRDLWEGKAVFQSGKESASEYDMAIANQMSGSGWTDQEILWTMYLCRQNHGHDVEKVIRRADYVELTLAKAKKSNVVATSARSLKNIAEDVQHLAEQRETAKENAAPEEVAKITQVIDSKKNEVFQEASTVIGVKITGFSMDGEGYDANFYLQIDGKDVRLGNIDEMMEVKNLRNTLIVSLKKMPNTITPHDWNMVVGAMIQFVECKVNPLLTSRYRVLSYIQKYTENAKPVSDNDEDEETRYHKFQVMKNNNPFWQNGKSERTLFVHIDSFLAFIAKLYQDRQQQDDISDALRELGGQPQHMYARYEGDRVHRYMWSISESKINEHIQELNKLISLANAAKTSPLTADTLNVKS